MIRSKIPANCELRGPRKEIIQIEIGPYEGTKTGITYTVNDYTISFDEDQNEVKQLINTKSVFYSAEKIIQLNEYLENTFDYSGMDKMTRDWTKIAQGLLLDTQTNLYDYEGQQLTIYRLNPNDWELC